MEIKDNILKQLPGGRKEDYIYGLQKARLKGVPVNLDAAGLCFYCALCHQDEYCQGDYYSSMKAFQDDLVYLQSIPGWDLLVVFDGKDLPWKDAEHERRYGSEEAAGGSNAKLRNNSTYIALFAKIVLGCRFLLSCEVWRTIPR